MKGKFAIFFQDKSFDPYFNLALEEYLLERPFEKTSYDSIFLIYRNDKSIVCGKNQSIWAQTNLKYCRENQIQIAKRLSGGGTVFHDLGNINFCFITPRTSKLVSNFSSFNAPIIRFLKGKGVNVESNQRNDLLIDGKKISGNAQHISKQRMISHATLLYNADLKNVSQSLKHPFKTVQTRAIDSKRVAVTNISNYLDSLSIDLFIKDFVSFMKIELGVNNLETINGEDEVLIHGIKENKFATNNWIYGNSPETIIDLDLPYENRIISLEIALEKGRIKNVNSPDTENDLLLQLNRHLFGSFFTYESLRPKIQSSNGDLNILLQSICQNAGI